MASFCGQRWVMRVELKPKNRVAKQKKLKKRTVAAINTQKKKTIVVVENADTQTAHHQQ